MPRRPRAPDACDRPLRAAALWRARDGAAAVEFALIAPLLILLLGGALSFGDALRVRVAVGNAARAGASWARLNGFDQARIAAAARAATGVGGIGVTATQSTLSCTNPASTQLVAANGATLCPATGAPPGSYVSVATSVFHTYIIPLPGNPATTTIGGNALARVR